jgi:hypothetical protein
MNANPTPAPANLPNPIVPRNNAVLVDFRPHQSGSRVGFATVRYPDFFGAAINGITIHIQGAAAWASPPGRAWVEDGELVRDPGGKIRYSQVFDFRTHGQRRRWSDAVIALMRAAHPSCSSSRRPRTACSGRAGRERVIRRHDHRAALARPAAGQAHHTGRHPGL